MTTLAYRDNILAADTQMTWADGSRRKVKKIVRLPDGSLFAGAGDAPAILKLKKWAEAGFPNKPKPRFSEATELDCILVKPDGTAWLIDRCVSPEQIDDDFVAIGSGGGYATGAMAMGASAIEAVEIAAKYDSSTGLPVDHVKLIEDKA